MEEQAALHVLGALSEAEAREFKRAMQADPELKNFVASLTGIVGALAATVPPIEPPIQLRAKILAQAGEKQKIISPPARKFSLANWLPWSLATCLVILCVLLFAQDTKLQNQVSAQTQKISELNSLARSLQAATNDLQQAVFALQETNRLANLKIAMLNSLLNDAPKAIAVSLWDNEKQDGVFVAQNLKALPANKEYQLWVLDNGTTPVDAGVFRVDENGDARVDFKTKLPIKIAGKFAVTEEIQGGVASPTLKNLVLASN
jgi:anti-sigma-K factor RskA